MDGIDDNVCSLSENGEGGYFIVTFYKNLTSWSKLGLNDAGDKESLRS